MTTHQPHRHPAVWALLAVTLIALLGGLTAPVALADPDPSGGKLVLVLDSSGSMAEPAGDGHTKIAAARTALSSVVTKLPATAQVGLRVYGATVFKRTQPGACTDTQLTVPIGTGNRPQLQAAIAKYKPFGETPIGYSLQQAAKDLGPTGQRTIVLVSDGEATCAPEPCAVARSIAQQGIDLKIDVVGFRVGGKARSQLQCVAREGRGDYYDADSTVDLEAGLGRLSTRAFRPFRISGTPVHGAPQQEGAPVLAPGHYSDTFGVDDTSKHYLIKRTMKGSTLRAGVSFRRPAGGSLVIQTEVRLSTPTGEQCGWSYPRAFDGDQGLATGTAASWSKYEKKNDECADSDQLVLTVNPGKDFRQLKGVPYELRINEEPPVDAIANLPAAAGDPVWSALSASTPREIVPGSSFPDAPLLQPGTYKTTLMPGELQLYKVNLDWGQRIQAQVTVPELAGAAGEALDGIRYLDTALISPIGEDVYAVFAKNVPGGAYTRGVLTKRGLVKAVTSKEVRYLNRNGANNQDTGTSTPGEYYIAVSLTRKDNDKAFTIPLNLTVGVIGTAGTGKPEYVDGATPVSGGTVTPSPTETTSETPAASPSDSGSSGDKNQAGGPLEDRSDSDGSTPVALITGLSGGGVVLLFVGLFLVLRLRRKPVAPQPGVTQSGVVQPGAVHPDGVRPAGNQWPSSGSPGPHGPQNPGGSQSPGGSQYPGGPQYPEQPPRR